MIRQAWPRDGREKPISESECLGISPIIRDVRLVELRVGFINPILYGPFEEGEFVQLTIVKGRDRACMRVIDIGQEMVRLVVQWMDNPVGITVSRCAIGSGERTKHAVESAVLFDNDDDMFDRGCADRLLFGNCRPDWRLRCLIQSVGQKQRHSDKNDQPYTRSER